MGCNPTREVDGLMVCGYRRKIGCRNPVPQRIRLAVSARRRRVQENRIKLQTPDEENRMKRTTIALALTAALAVTFSGCRKKGPAEELGEKIDDAVKDLKESVEKDGPAEKAGESVDKLLDGK